MALLAQIGTGNDNLVWLFAIFYVYNMHTQVLDHNRDFYLEQEVVFLDFFIEKLCF
jgi:hypothetical protein